MIFVVAITIVGLGIFLDFADYQWIAQGVYLIAFAVLAVLARAGKGPNYISAEFEEVRTEIVRMRVRHDETNAEIARLKEKHEETKAGVAVLSEEYKAAQAKVATLEIENARLIAELEKERNKVKIYRELLGNDEV